MTIEPGNFFTHERLGIFTDQPEDDQTVFLPFLGQIDRMIFHPKASSPEERFHTIIEQIDSFLNHIFQELQHDGLLYGGGER